MTENVTSAGEKDAWKCVARNVRSGDKALQRAQRHDTDFTSEHELKAWLVSPKPDEGGKTDGQKPRATPWENVPQNTPLPAGYGSDFRNVKIKSLPRSSSASEIHSSAVCACARSPGPNTTLGMPPADNTAASQKK